MPPFQVNSEARGSSSSAPEGETQNYKNIFSLFFMSILEVCVLQRALNEKPNCFQSFAHFQPRLNNSSEELGLNEERSLTVRRFPNSENGPSQVARRQSTPEQGNKVEHSSPDFLSASVSSPGLLSHASDPGKSQPVFSN